MSKRHYQETDEERWLRKKKKYESKLRRGRKNLIIYSDEEGETIEENWEPESYPSHANEVCDTVPSIQMSNEVSPHDLPILSEPPAPTVHSEAPIALDNADNSDVDPELLEALGAFEEETTEWAEPVVEHIAMRLKPLLLNGFEKDEKDLLLKKYPFPKNVTLAKAPTLNAEVSAMLSEPSRNRDKRLYKKQNQLGSALSAITKAMSLLLRKDPKITDILSILSDATKLLADSHFLETDTRKSLITPLIDKELIEPFKDRKRDDYLFGDNLGELVKNSRGIKKTGQLIQASTSNNLNHKGPSSRGRSQKNYANRGGGQQRSHRRATHYAPPPGSQRYQPQFQARHAPQLQTQYAPPLQPRRRQPLTNVTTASRSTLTASDRTTAGTHP